MGECGVGWVVGVCVCLLCVCTCSYFMPSLLGPTVHSLVMDQEVLGSNPTVTINGTDFTDFG